MFSPDNLLSCLTQFPIQHIYLGYSGGLDSHVLLHALHDLKQRYSLPPITAIHINHGLSPHAHEWESHCEGVCEKLKIPFQSFSIKISEDKSQSLEEKAREARYQIFSELMKPNDALLTAHQKNDQAETVLYRLFRGTGLKGLSGMSVAMPYVTGYLLRPLLPYTRQELEVYATTHELQWIEDESNTNTRFDRNFIRHSVLPLLKTRWTEVENHLTRVADFSTEAQILLEDLADQDKKFCEGSVSNTLSIQKLLTLTPERQNNVLRYWFQTFDIALPSQRKLQHIMTDVIHSRADAMPEVIWGTSCVRRYKDDLHVLSLDKQKEISWEKEWDLKEPLVLPGNLGLLKAEQTLGRGITLPEEERVTVRFRRGGEYCHPVGRQGSHPLKKCFQEWNIPQWERSQVPLIYYNDELVAVVGYCICEPYQADPNQNGIEFKRLF